MTDNTATATADINATADKIIADAIAGDPSGYVAADKIIKARVRAMFDKIIGDAIRSRSADAFDMSDARDAMIAAGKINSTPDVDVDKIIADRIATLRAAADMIESGKIIPAGIDADKINWATVRTMIDSRATIADDDAAARMAGTKITRSGDRVDIAAHVAEVILDAAPGTFFKISDAANVRTTAAPDGLPSHGALAARLFPSSGVCTVADIVPVDATATAPRGFVVA